MLIRYGQDKKGKSVPIAKVYVAEEHHIPNRSIDIRALKIIRRLQHAHYETYLVGGAVRDLLLNQEPKDFDIVTNARPEEVRKLFRNSRIIGKRFKLVHIYFGSTNIEVATFRSKDAGNHVNEYGTIEEDALRRDFSLNALYYDPVKSQLLDYVEAMADFESKQLRSIIPLQKTFKEDPIRMLRGVKYSVTTGFTIPKKEAKQIRSQRRLLKSISSSRMTEEVLKILANPRMVEIFEATHAYGLLSYMLPKLAKQFGSSKGEIQHSLQELCTLKDPPRWKMIYHLTKSGIKTPKSAHPRDIGAARKDIYKQVKAIITPLTPPNVDVERTTMQLLKDFGYTPKPKRRNKHSGSKGNQKKEQA